MAFNQRVHFAQQEGNAERQATLPTELARKKLRFVVSTNSAKQSSRSHRLRSHRSSSHRSSSLATTFI
jgi:hypothetical protein